MIVNYTLEGWQIIAQKSHGLLAGQFCFYWNLKDRPKRWFEILISATEHDDASNEFEDDALLNKSGGPIDFSMKAFDKSFYDKMLALSLTKSRYIALLNLKHIQFLFSGVDNQKAVDYAKSLEKTKKKWLKEIDMDEVELNKAYQILEWCDAISLLICQNKIQPEKRKIEVSTDANGQTYYMWEKEDHVLQIEPWPFEISSFVIRYESKTIKTLQFANSEQFTEELLNTKVDEHEFEVVSV